MNEAVARNDNMCKGEITSVKQYNIVLHNTLYCTLQYYTMEYITVMYCTVLYFNVQFNTAQHIIENSMICP